MFIECECLLLNVYIQWSNAKQKKHRAAGVIGQNKKKLYALDNRGTMLYFLGSVVEHIQLQSGPDFGQYRAQNDRNWWISGVAL